MQQLVNNLSQRIGCELGYDKEQIAVMSYGMLCIAQMLFITIVSATIGIITGTVLESLIVVTVVGLYRKNAGGVHASSMESCITISLAVIAAMAIGSKYLFSGLAPQNMMMVIHIVLRAFTLFIAYKYVPIDSPAKRLTKPEVIKKLRVRTFTLLLVLFIGGIILIIMDRKSGNRTFESFYYATELSLLWQSLTLTPLGVKVVGSANRFVNRILSGK